MKLEMRGQMRLEQKMKLAPHMIQSMEILQLPILALQERIEQELNSNPVLELEEPSTETVEPAEIKTDEPESDVPAELERPEDFGRIESLDDDYTDYMSRAESFYTPVSTDEPDRKFEAIKNTAAGACSLHEHLTEQWRLVEAEEKIKKAGAAIIDYIDDKGYLSVRLEQLYNKDRNDYIVEDLKAALSMVQKLDPPGIGARDLKECLLIQLNQSSEDTSFETRLVSGYMEELLDNRIPDIAKKMNCSIDDIKQAVKRLSKFDISPGLQIGRTLNHPIKADVIVERDEDSGEFIVRLADYDLPPLRINDYYAAMAKDPNTAEKTKKFLQSNIRSAQWIIEAVEQRKNTLLKVARSVVKFQQDFFENGQLYLKPLPMSKVAEEVGVHIATVSRAVAGKYLQCWWGLLPLRKFFSGGTEDANGQSHSWHAIRAKLQQIIDSEDKTSPLSDDQIKEKLTEEGIQNIARRTVAKYRKILNIPSARYRKKY
jgi:RNA polymerase sigma-54 factor